MFPGFTPYSRMLQQWPPAWRSCSSARGKDTNLIVIGGDGSTFDIGMGSNSGMFERGHKILYVCYDNEAYMNTGVQRSGSTPFCAHTTTTPSGSQSQGNPRPKKDMPAIALAHKVPYVATASVAYPVDLRRKVKKALQVNGPSYIQVNAPCITGWTFDAGTMIELARLAVETGLWPLTEYENGELTGVKKMRRPKPAAGVPQAAGPLQAPLQESENVRICWARFRPWQMRISPSTSWLTKHVCGPNSHSRP